MTTDEAKLRIVERIEREGIGKKAVNYKLRDWVFSRQRYWGEPIPLVHCERDGIVRRPRVRAAPPPARDEELRAFGHGRIAPGEHPRVGRNDLPQMRRAREARDEHDAPVGRLLLVLPALPGSARTASAFASKEASEYWMPVDLYVGGAEHAVLHLLYSRFWHKVLYDIGAVSTKEPFARLINQGMILGEDNQKMSKSRGNVINPDDIIKEFGADAMRVYEMFMGPLEVSKPWATAGLIGVSRFLEKLWALSERVRFDAERDRSDAEGRTTASRQGFAQGAPSGHKESELRYLDLEFEHRDLRHDDLRQRAGKARANARARSGSLSSSCSRPTRPTWPRSSGSGRATRRASRARPWPTYDESLCADETKEIVVQVNGKIRERFTAGAGSAETEIEARARALPKVAEWTRGKRVAKVSSSRTSWSISSWPGRLASGRDQEQGVGGEHDAAKRARTRKASRSPASPAVTAASGLPRLSASAGPRPRSRSRGRIEPLYSTIRS